MEPRIPADERDSLGHGVRNVRLWLALGLVFWVLGAADRSTPRSPLWFTELLLYAFLVALLWLDRGSRRRRRWSVPRRWAPIAYVALVWLLGVVFETSLTVTGEGIGGVHRQTFASFVLAQGDYLPLALVSWLAIRHLHLSFRQVFFLAAGKSLTEGLVFTGVLATALVSPQFFLAPLVAAYYAIAYASFLATPLLVLDERQLWRAKDPVASLSMPWIVVLGFALAFVVRVFWGVVYSPIAIRVFDLPQS